LLFSLQLSFGCLVHIIPRRRQTHLHASGLLHDALAYDGLSSKATDLVWEWVLTAIAADICAESLHFLISFVLVIESVQKVAD